MKFFLIKFYCLLLFLLISNAYALPITTSAKYALIVDYETGNVLYEKESNKRISPASMSKLMTLYILFEAIQDGSIDLDSEFLVSTKAWKKGGSRMFLEPESKVKVIDLIRGIIIQSGNDASVAIAEYVGGTERGFVDLMNAYAGSLNMNNTIFQNSTGLPAENHFSSAKDLAILTSHLITKFPEIYSFYKEKQFTFNEIKQLNRNKLLWRDDSSDGVKTGHTKAAGYCLVGSSKRGDMRLITVVAGSDSDNNRFMASQRLLEYGFRFFATQKILNANQEYKQINIWGGVEKSLGLGVLEDISITLPRTSFKDLVVNYNYSNNIQAPIEIGQKIGTLEIVNNDEIVLSTDLVALQNIKAKGFFGRLWSKFVLWILSLFGMTDNGSD